MINDRIENGHRCAALHPLFGQAFDFLREAWERGIEPGKHVLIRDQLWIVAERGDGRGSAARLEAHRRYIDIQLVLEGTERISWRARRDCRNAIQSYDPDRDIEFYSDPPSTWIDLQPGEFAIFFPDDAHAPLAGATPVFKAIAKVGI